METIFQFYNPDKNQSFESTLGVENSFELRETKAHWVIFWKYIFYVAQDYSHKYYKIMKKHGCLLTNYSLRNS